MWLLHLFLASNWSPLVRTWAIPIAPGFLEVLCNSVLKLLYCIHFFLWWYMFFNTIFSPFPLQERETTDQRYKDRKKKKTKHPDVGEFTPVVLSIKITQISQCEATINLINLLLVMFGQSYPYPNGARPITIQICLGLILAFIGCTAFYATKKKGVSRILFRSNAFEPSSCIAIWSLQWSASLNTPWITASDATPCLFPHPVLSFSRRAFPCGWREAELHGPAENTEKNMAG